MLLEVVALFEDLQQFSVSLLTSFLDPLLKLGDVEAFVDVERRLEIQLQSPALEVATFADEIY